MPGLHRHPDDRAQSVSHAVPDVGRACSNADRPRRGAGHVVLRTAVADALGRSGVARAAAPAVRRRVRARQAQAARAVAVTPAPATLDWGGTVHAAGARDARIGCLVPSITELVFALELGSAMVARTGFCVHPRDG